MLNMLYWKINMAKIFVLTLILIINAIISGECLQHRSSEMTHQNTKSVCGDGWDQFNDNGYDICYKYIPDELADYDTVVKYCEQQQDSTLPTINTPAEQDFLNKMIIKYQMVDNVWLDAGVKDKHIVWTDKSSDEYENWMTGRPHSNGNCVEMITDYAKRGKWRDQACGKKNAYICKRVVMGPDVRIGSPISDNRLELDSAMNKIAQLEQKLGETDLKINTIEQNQVPLGFIYVQFPDQAEPKTLWPTYTWSDVTATYAGQFFRAEGGGSLSFGQGTQSENAPRLTSVERHDGEIHNTPFTVNINPGQWSNYILTGPNGASDHEYHRFFVTGGEVRPRNQAVRIFKRIS